MCNREGQCFHASTRFSWEERASNTTGLAWKEIRRDISFSFSYLSKLLCSNILAYKYLS